MAPRSILPPHPEHLGARVLCKAFRAMRNHLSRHDQCAAIPLRAACYNHVTRAACAVPSQLPLINWLP
jgi:hypothetical protein